MDNKTITSNLDRIIIFGQQNLQNSILIGFIQQNTGISCELTSIFNWRDNWNSFEGQTLVLIDAENEPQERVQDLLEQVFDTTTQTKVAFFNTQHASPIERLVSWPMVNGIFYKETSQEMLVKGITCILNGEFWLSRRLVAEHLQRTRSKPRKQSSCAKLLTRREKQILTLTATGATNTQIAENLNVSMHTVKTHIYNLFKKIDASNRIQAVNWAKENLEGLQEKIA